MTAGSALAVVLALLGGATLGVLHFAGLWLTLQKLHTSSRPHMWIAGSSVVRTLLTAGGLLIVTRGRLVPLFAALAGFLVVRTVAARRIQAPRVDPEEAA